MGKTFVLTGLARRPTRPETVAVARRCIRNQLSHAGSSLARWSAGLTPSRHAGGPCYVTCLNVASSSSASPCRFGRAANRRSVTYYRGHLLTDTTISPAPGPQCADDAVCTRQGREVIAAERRFAAVEIWTLGHAASIDLRKMRPRWWPERRRRNCDARTQDQAIAMR